MTSTAMKGKRSSVRVVRYDADALEREIAKIERERGTLASLREKAERELLTAEDLAALRRLDGLTYLRDAVA